MPMAPNIVPKALIRYALDDKYPYHWGALMTIAVVTARLRQCERGDRAQWVDLLNELREGHPHAHAVLGKRYTKTSSLPYTILRAETDNPRDEAIAEVVARTVEHRIARIPRWKTHVHGLCWAGFTGASCREIMWRRDADGWWVDELKLVHSRRIGVGDEFKPYIINGLAVERLDPADYPAKFIMHMPAMADEHPTRTGLGRVLAYWMSFFRMINRSWLNYTERFGNPFPMATWRTGRDFDSDGVATDAEIEAAKQLVQDIGRGSQPGWAGPDSIKLDLAGAATTSSGGSGENTVHKAQLAFINAEISKAVTGGDLNTESRESGSRALGQSQAEDAEAMPLDDAGQLDETVTRDLVRWIVELNFGADVAKKFCPTYHTVVEDEDDAAAIADVIETAHGFGMQIPAAWAHEKLNIPMAQPGEPILGDNYTEGREDEEEKPAEDDEQDTDEADDENEDDTGEDAEEN